MLIKILKRLVERTPRSCTKRANTYAMIRKMGTQKATTGTIELKNTLPKLFHLGIRKKRPGSWNNRYRRTPHLQDPACRQKAQNSRKKASSAFLPVSHTSALNCKGVRGTGL